MTCPICRQKGHGAEACPSAPEKLTQKDFTEMERAEKQRDILEAEVKFIDKVVSVVGKIPFALDAAAMYYAMLDPKTPFWVKASVAGALLYFISPLDAIPDFIPVVGYADDAAVVYATLSAVHRHITDEHIAKAKVLLKQT